MRIHKYHSCENSFLILDYKEIIDYSSLALKLCDELFSDGLIVFKNDPMEMLFYNKDGSEAKMCGNGIRALTHYIHDKFKIYNHLNIKTKSGNYECEIISKEPFVSSVSLGIGECFDNFAKKKIIVKDKEFICTLFELGVKHLVVLTEDMIEDEKYITELFEYPILNKEVNINLVKPLNNNIFEILTYEKGVGFTKSCGTGAAASAYILHQEYNLEESLIAVCPGGILKIDILDEIILTGESNFVEEYEFSE